MRLCILLLLAAFCAQSQTGDSLNFFRALEDGRRADEMLTRYLYQRANRLLEERERRVLATRDWNAYRRDFRAALLLAIGGLPERTPLNARVVGTLERDGYRIEKVVFESRPQFFVTANLYLPRSGQPPYPAILFPLGHEAGAKAHSAWQIVLANLAKRGFLLLAWDPIGQGERIQIWDEDLKASKLLQSTTEHTMQGIQSLLLGDALARYTIWDSIRALDYLLSRPEADAKRVGITGNSGGGTHTAYVASLDDRIHVAAPSCYITNWRKLLETIGPQDAEQVFPGWLAAGYDHPDFLLAFAPKPYLVLSAVRDFFSIGGARETYQQAKRVYDALGQADRLQMVEADDGHGYTKPRREAAYRFFTRHLNGTEDNTSEFDIKLATERELNCTATGQVATAFQGETVSSLNRKRLTEVRRKGSLDAVSRLTKFQIRPAPVRVHLYGSQPFGRARMQKLVYETEPGIQIPALLFTPEGNGRRAASIVVHGRGKSATRDMVEERLRAGEMVLSIDARGFGETAKSTVGKSIDWQRYFGDYDMAMTAILVGKPIVIMRAEDISAAAGLLVQRDDVDASRISLYGIEAGATPALYAAALDQRIRSLTLDGVLASYESVIEQRIHRRIFEHVVPGALRAFDLPDLAAWIAPRPVRVVSKLDPLGLPVE
jgi:cephalosporin-C deacetylase-like acetyl esterase